MENNLTTPRILVGVDGSDHSVAALRGASRIAAAMHANIRAVSAWEYPTMFYPVPDWSPKDDAAKALDAALEQAFGTDLPANLEREVLCGNAPKVLIEQSKDADMLVLGSRGHGGFTGMLLGSVSAACAQHAHCPVLILHRGDTSKITGSTAEADAPAAR